MSQSNTTITNSFVSDKEKGSSQQGPVKFSFPQTHAPLTTDNRQDQFPCSPLTLDSPQSKVNAQPFRTSSQFGFGNSTYQDFNQRPFDNHYSNQPEQFSIPNTQSLFEEVLELRKLIQGQALLTQKMAGEVSLLNQKNGVLQQTINILEREISGLKHNMGELESSILADKYHEK